MKNKWKVYKIDFGNGVAYVGITSGDLQKRFRQHTDAPVNRKLARRLKMGLPYTKSLLSTHRLEVCARRREGIEIRRLRYPLNHVHVKPNKRDYKPQHDKQWQCMVCHEVKPGTEFYRNRCRASGLQSRCKACDAARVTDTRRTIKAMA